MSSNSVRVGAEIFEAAREHGFDDGVMAEVNDRIAARHRRGKIVTFIDLRAYLKGRIGARAFDDRLAHAPSGAVDEEAEWGAHATE